jgi:hypothetical protein
VDGGDHSSRASGIDQSVGAEAVGRVGLDVWGRRVVTVWSIYDVTVGVGF